MDQFFSPGSTSSQYEAIQAIHKLDNNTCREGTRANRTPPTRSHHPPFFSFPHRVTLSLSLWSAASLCVSSEASSPSTLSGTCPCTPSTTPETAFARTLIKGDVFLKVHLTKQNERSVVEEGIGGRGVNMNRLHEYSSLSFSKDKKKKSLLQVEHYNLDK